MSFIIFILALYLLFRNKRDNRRSDLVKWVFGGTVLLYVMSLLSLLPFSPIVVAGILWYAISRIRSAKREYDYDTTRSKWESDFERMFRQGTGSEEQKSSQNSASGAESRKTSQTSQTSGHRFGPFGRATYDQVEKRGVKSTILPRPATKRTKIVKNFNKKFKLTLTDDEIKRIVDASYMSEAWKKEVEAMTQKYESAYEWFAGDTAWLRIYIYSFQIQNISADFQYQEKIVEETLDEVMKYAESFEHLTLPERIQRVNEQYFTTFEEASFMMAYRFLQEKGHSYNLEKVEVIRNEDDLEQRMRKYQ